MKTEHYNPNSAGQLNSHATDLDLINKTVDQYNQQMLNHPLDKIFNSSGIPRGLLNEYASLQYIDSVLWLPMLALMKDRVKSPRLKKTLTENILCEAGAKHTSHITLGMQFIKSLGISPYNGDSAHYRNSASHPVEMMNAVSGMSEAQIASWALVAEAIVPALFQLALPAYERVDGVDLIYLSEHITVDSDEHAAWMRESVAQLLSEGVSLDEILVGIHLGARTALCIPDVLFAKFLRGGYESHA